MKQRGGYGVPLSGRPSHNVETPPEPQRLVLPLQSRTFDFTDVRVQSGDQVKPGGVLAVDPKRFSVPLLAPRAGTVDLESAAGHVVLTNLTRMEEEPYDPRQDAQHIDAARVPHGDRRRQLLSLGAWQFFRDAHTGDVPDPFGTPQAVIASTLSLEPFLSRGDAQLCKRLRGLTRGLEHIQQLLEYQPIHLVVPDIQSQLADEVRQLLRGHAFVQPLFIKPTYPHDHFRLLVRQLGLKHDPDRPVWALRTEGVLAVDRAMSLARPCTVRVIAIGGPAAINPTHVKAMPGYPMDELLEDHTAEGPVRILDGGALTGRIWPEDRLGLDTESTGITVLADEAPRQFLGFARPGWDRQSFHRGFLSRLRAPFEEPLNTALRGERRACIACGACQEVCPAGIWPHLIHKRLAGEDGVDPAAAARIDLCIDCGLCSYVCPAKLELADQFAAAKRQLDLQRAEDEELAREAKAEAAAAETASAEKKAGQGQWLAP